MAIWLYGYMATWLYTINMSSFVGLFIAGGRRTQRSVFARPNPDSSLKVYAFFAAPILPYFATVFATNEEYQQ